MVRIGRWHTVQHSNCLLYTSRTVMVLFEYKINCNTRVTADDENVQPCVP